MSNLSVADWRDWKKAPTDPPSPVLQAAINAAEEAISDDLKRLMVVASGTPSARTYVPESGEPLRIHDCVAVTSVTSNGVALVAGTDYQLEPVGNSWSGQDRPYLYVRLIGGSWHCDRGRATVSVVADWGWTALPAAYTEATKILTADIVESADVRNGVMGFADYGAVRVKENAMVVKLLHDLRTAEAVLFAVI